MMQSGLYDIRVLMDSLPKCKCGSGNSICSYCVDKSCPNFNKYACNKCEKVEHSHQIYDIASIIIEEAQLWEGLYNKSTQMKNKATQNLSQYKQLIGFLDQKAKAKGIEIKSPHTQLQRLISLGGYLYDRVFDNDFSIARLANDLKVESILAYKPERESTNLEISQFDHICSSDFNKDAIISMYGPVMAQLGPDELSQPDVQPEIRLMLGLSN